MKLNWRLAGLPRMFIALGCLSLLTGMSGGVGLAAPERSASVSTTAVATTTSVANATENYGDGGVTLTATVTAQDNSIINQGTVQFVVRSHNGFTIGQTKKVVVAGGKATFLDKIKTSTAVATYTITASYSGGTLYSPSSGTGTLTINPVPTTTTIDPASATFGDPSANLTVSVAAINGVLIDKGSATITVTNTGNTVIGSPVTAVMTTSVVSVSYLIPTGTPGGSYKISASYTGNKSLAPSTGTSSLTIGPVATVTAPFSITTTVGTPSVYLSAFVGATVASTGQTLKVGSGGVTFTVTDANGVPIGNPAQTIVVKGVAVAPFTIPSGTQSGTYTITASFSDSSSYSPSVGTAILTIT